MNNVMTYKGYTASMSYDPDDKILVGRLLGIANIICFHAESAAEAAFHEAIDDDMAACAKMKQSSEKPVSGKLMLRIDAVIHSAAAKGGA